MEGCNNTECGMHTKMMPMKLNCAYVWNLGPKQDCSCYIEATETPQGGVSNSGELLVAIQAKVEEMQKRIGMPVMLVIDSRGPKYIVSGYDSTSIRKICDASEIETFSY